MKIKMLTVNGIVDGVPVTIHPVLVEIKGSSFLIDCGYAETFDALIAELTKEGVAVTDLEAVIISHDDIDHLGGLQKCKQANPHLKVYCSAVEERSVSGRIKSERLVQAEQSLPALPPEYQKWATGFIAMLQAIHRYPVDSTLQDGKLFKEHLLVVHTPGHTSGHLSFYYPEEKTLITSDAIVIENGQLDIANPAFTLDLPAAIASVEEIRSLQPEKLICYHGGRMEKDIEQQLMALIEKYKSRF